MKSRNLTFSDVKTYRAETQIAIMQEKSKKKAATSSFRGVGTIFYGSYYRSEEEERKSIQTRIKWFIVLYFPIWPIEAYRFQLSNDEDQLIDAVHLNWNKAIEVWMKAIGISLLIYLAILASHNWRLR